MDNQKKPMGAIMGIIIIIVIVILGAVYFSKNKISKETASNGQSDELSSIEADLGITAENLDATDPNEPDPNY